MASIDDVFHQLQAVNTNLSTLHADGIAETNATNQVKSSVDTVDADVKAGFNATVHGLTTIALIDIEAVKLLFHLTQQTDTVICTLENISRNTCAMLTQMTIQTQLQQRMTDDLDAIRAMEEAEQPAAALERARLTALQAEIERCCPPEQTPPACTYQPCPKVDPARMPDLPKVGGDGNRPPGIN